MKYRKKKLFKLQNIVFIFQKVFLSLFLFNFYFTFLMSYDEIYKKLFKILSVVDEREKNFCTFDFLIFYFSLFQYMYVHEFFTFTYLSYLWITHTEKFNYLKKKVYRHCSVLNVTTFHSIVLVSVIIARIYRFNEKYALLKFLQWNY